MILRIISSLVLATFAILILTTSIFRTAQVKYDFQLTPTPTPNVNSDTVHIDYNLPPVNYINPSHPLWPFKVVKDKLWLTVNSSHLKKAQINLYLANNRLSFAQNYFEDQNYDEAVRIIQKSEQYLLQSYGELSKAHEGGADTLPFAYELSMASLKHRQVLENFLDQSPEDAKPIIIKNTDPSKIVFEKSSHLINSKGQNPPNNPFDL